MMNCLAVGLGGFAGAVLRYLIGLIPTGETMIFPAKTFCINIYHILNLCTGVFGADPGWTYGNRSVLCIA